MEGGGGIDINQFVTILGGAWRANKNSDYTYLSYAFNIEPVKGWTKSLVEVGK